MEKKEKQVKICWMELYLKCIFLFDWLSFYQLDRTHRPPNERHYLPAEQFVAFGVGRVRWD